MFYVNTFKQRAFIESLWTPFCIQGHQSTEPEADTNDKKCGHEIQKSKLFAHRKDRNSVNERHTNFYSIWSVRADFLLR